MKPGEAVNGALRKAILASSGNARMRGFAAKHGLRLGASRFVAGDDLEACVAVLRRLNEQGFSANTTLLGEDVLEEAETRAVVEEYETILARLHDEELKANVALKLTHLGLDIDEELAFENVRRVVERAAELGNFIRIDMESSALVDPTLRTFRRLREAGLDNVGTVLQSYLYRTPEDLEGLLPLAPNLRFVKGAYLEPESVAYPRKEDVDSAYLRLVERSLTGGGYTAIATHDERMIEHALAFAEHEGIGRDRFELQMLYGVRPQLQLDLVARGYEVLVATPFGPEWFPFFTRRLAERPANLTFVVRNLLRR
ncbi:MAG TPA: proline dehydrogenase family protein [Gaiellaceae bacterium]|nr:proline dehydrogenase family protein [Gaiellaceae bacterium]